jgi:hypothetical protein
VTALVSQVAWARLLGISLTTFRVWRQQGRIPLPLALPGHPRWSSVVVERVTRELQQAGQGRYFRAAVTRRINQPRQPRASQPEQSERPLHASRFSGQAVNQVHGGESDRSASGNPLNKVERTSL